MDSPKPLTLYALNNMVRNTLAEGLSSRYWVTGELSEVRETAAGHCYVELVQRDEAANEIVAKARATIWMRVYSLLRPYFLEQTGRSFSVGLKVLLQVTVVFHELYGYSLDVCDIEPSYTLGDMFKQRRMILDRLTEEGVVDLNKELPFPQLPRKIAVISSSYAAGYGDFSHQLQNNPYGLVFYPCLFPAPMQGAKVEQGIISALGRIAENIDFWDVVVIIRGGGATSELSCFDTYDLANNCAQFPLPIITGIGHHRDDTLLDAVSHVHVKTPTAAAEFLIHKMAEQAIHIEELRTRIVDAVRGCVDNARMRLQTIVRNLPMTTEYYMQRQRHKLELLEHSIASVSPQRILSLGYTITMSNGRVVRSADDINQGDEVVTHTAAGEFISVVK